ncbi:hypothetical protein GCM10023263_76630 [Phytohabitans rumicis]
MDIHHTGGIRRSLQWVAAVAVGVAASIAAVAPASAAPVDVTGGALDWGFKASFRAYVQTGNGNPPIAVSNGATRNADGTFKFPATGCSSASPGGRPARWASRCAAVPAGAARRTARSTPPCRRTSPAPGRAGRR